MGFALALQIGGWLVGVPLEILIIAAVSRQHYRQYPLFFVYMIADFLTTVIDISVTISYYAQVPGSKGVRVLWYWINEGILQFLVFALVISLVYHATAMIRTRRLVRTVLVTGAAVFAAGSFLAHYGKTLALSAWMTPWARDLNFCSAILDLALWAMLIASREKDRRLLILSGALGIQFTGEAIGEAIRGLTTNRNVVYAGNTIMMVANLVVLYIWWQAFRDKPRKVACSARATTKSSAS